MGSLKDVYALQQAKAVIENPAHWGKGWLAKDARGHEECTTSDYAQTFCAVGALYRALGISSDVAGGRFTGAYKAVNSRTFTDPFHYLAATTPVVIMEDDRGGEVAVNIPPTAYNDAEERTHDEVMEWYDRAIAKAIPR